MTVNQALDMAAALLTVANQALQSSRGEIDYLEVLRLQDDAARAELQAAIDAASATPKE